MMEARRLEKQRRESAKSKAASQLPSSQEQEFNLRLIDLYRSQECLWNTSLTEHSDAERKSRAWEEIAAGMGSHLSAAFVRSRMRNLRYKLNVYKLQVIEFQMMPGKLKMPPEKPYFVDRLDFLDGEANSGSSTEPSRARPADGTSPERLGNLWSNFDLKKPLETLTKLSREAPAAVPRSGPSIAATVKQRLESQMKPLEFLVPRGTISRLQRQLRSSRLPEQSSSSGSVALSETPIELQARPGESISLTKLAWKRQMYQLQEQEHPTTSRNARESVESEDEELYSLHWNMRRQRRSLRLDSSEPGQDLGPTLPAGLRSSQADEPNPDVF
ncbi:uncharacterized protein [Drosophila kikkawai]|uniref:MADF domain-containing protein n=1 Tax=Drosophila kikkawai TaxID=30033 RepID=A0A6P4IZI5_DROKI|nr:uncharacterized protein LOC108082912 [Drosophila kikkawai]KAH8345219.1 hypothetical protein KR059_010550 [Drosophila kikkawai]